MFYQRRLTFALGRVICVWNMDSKDSGLQTIHNSAIMTSDIYIHYYVKGWVYLKLELRLDQTFVHG